MGRLGMYFRSNRLPPFLDRSRGPALLTIGVYPNRHGSCPADTPGSQGSMRVAVDQSLPGMGLDTERFGKHRSFGDYSKETGPGY